MFGLLNERNGADRLNHLRIFLVHELSRNWCYQVTQYETEKYHLARVAHKQAQVAEKPDHEFGFVMADTELAASTP